MSRMLTLLGAGMALMAAVAPGASAHPSHAHPADHGKSEVRFVHSSAIRRSSQYDQRIIRILGSVAAHQIHGFSGDNVPVSQLESELAAGQRIVVSCGTVSQIGLDAATQAGYEARVVGSFTRQPLNGNDGHVMLEVRLREGWTVFDLDNNRMAPLGVGITDLVRHPDQWGQMIAHDPAYDTATAEIAASGLPPAYYRSIFTHLGAWYRRVLGVPWIRDSAGTNWFHDASDQARGLSLGFQPASDQYWASLGG